MEFTSQRIKIYFFGVCIKIKVWIADLLNLTHPKSSELSHVHHYLSESPLNNPKFKVRDSFPGNLTSYPIFHLIIAVKLFTYFPDQIKIVHDQIPIEENCSDVLTLPGDKVIVFSKIWYIVTMEM